MLKRKEKVPYSIQKYEIPAALPYLLTIVSELQEEIRTKRSGSCYPLFWDWPVVGNGLDGDGRGSVPGGA